ncbi:MAG: hypothetical protein CMF50_09060 [Legionellales bacterium]|nr:hypothetical protein [Legionellales bacterium]|tara:strand:+ start:8758 stop:9753 length:996 start_codon:yes stop_codon:yes gene_type:complete
MRDKLFTAVIFILELCGVGYLIIPFLPIWVRVTTFLGLHLFAALLTMTWSYYMLPHSTRVRERRAFMTFSSCNFIIPFAGPIQFIIWTLYILSQPLMSKLQFINEIDNPVFSAETPFVPPQYGEGGAVSQLSAPTLAIKKRIDALMAIDSSQVHGSNKALREVLSDSTDEIRLLAFGILDAKEKNITDKIHDLEDKLKLPHSAHHKAILEKEIAEFFWELVYQDLIIDDLQNYILVRALEHAERAAKVLKTDAGMWVLLSRIYIRLNKLDKGEQALKKADECGAPASKVWPYIAELLYGKRQWAELKRILFRNKGLRDIPHIGPVIDFWCK